jgi:LacI family transcriptional regulator
MGHKRTRLRDIAEKTGFSANTVSLALRDSPRIPEATRILIRKVADDLNYTPNRIAQSLVSQRTMMVGLVLTDTRNPILTQVAQEVSGSLAEHGYATLFATSANDPARERDVIATLRERQVDGMLVYPTEHDAVDHLYRLRENGFPLVSLAPDRQKRLDTVSSDDETGALKAVRHLVAKGRRNIALLDAATPLGNREKRDGYLKGLSEAGIALPDAWQIGVSHHGVKHGIDAMDELARRGVKPDAVLATNDSLALGVEIWCQKHGLRLPDDLALVGFDNIEFARLTAVPVTTVAYPVEQIVRAAVTRLEALMAGESPLPEPVQTAFEPELIVRASSGG